MSEEEEKLQAEYLTVKEARRMLNKLSPEWIEAGAQIAVLSDTIRKIHQEEASRQKRSGTDGMEP